MCYPKPGPRCSNHARQEVAKARVNAQVVKKKFIEAKSLVANSDDLPQDAKLNQALDDYLEAMSAVTQAQEDYDSTPDGMRELGLKHREVTQDSMGGTVPDSIIARRNSAVKKRLKETRQMRGDVDVYADPKVKRSMFSQWTEEETKVKRSMLTQWLEGKNGSPKAHEARDKRVAAEKAAQRSKKKTVPQPVLVKLPERADILTNGRSSAIDRFALSYDEDSNVRAEVAKLLSIDDYDDQKVLVRLADEEPSDSPAGIIARQRISELPEKALREARHGNMWSTPIHEYFYQASRFPHSADRLEKAADELIVKREEIDNQ